MSHGADESKPDDTPQPDQDKPVSDTVDKPETVNPAPEHTPPPVEPNNGADALTALSKRIDDLEAVVTAVVTKADPDSKPVSTPWTHRRLFGGKNR